MSIPNLKQWNTGLIIVGTLFPLPFKQNFLKINITFNLFFFFSFLNFLYILQQNISKSYSYTAKTFTNYFENHCSHFSKETFFGINRGSHYSRLLLIISDHPTSARSYRMGTEGITLINR